jgi:hypothetical protein
VEAVCAIFGCGLHHKAIHIELKLVCYLALGSLGSMAFSKEFSYQIETTKEI